MDLVKNHRMIRFSKLFKFSAFISLSVVGLLLAGCRQGGIPDITFVQDEVPELPLILPDSADSVYVGLRNSNSVLAFYRGQRQRPAWVDNERTRALGDSLVGFIAQIRYYGLRPQHYHLTELAMRHRLWWRPEFLLRRDVLLTDAFLSLARDLRLGHLAINVNDSTGLALLREVLVNGGLEKRLEAIEPDFNQYRNLRKGLGRLIASADSAQRALLLRGMTLDTIPMHQDVRTIEINLERWRAERASWGRLYIFVNLPSYMVEMIDEDRVVLESRAIVGKPAKATPEFSSMIQCFVTYPYWHVPRKISVEEFLPIIQRDTSFIRRNNFDVLDRKGRVLTPDSVDWKRFNKNNFPVILRQREGTENSLGVIKFVFDNPYAVFLHDTNAPRLFRLKNRALSHGCVRIEKAETLAHLLVTGEPGKKSAVIAGYLDQKLRHTIDLARPIPIHIRYFTATADADGNVSFPEDVYEKDGALIQSLYRSAPFVSATSRADIEFYPGQGGR